MALVPYYDTLTGEAGEDDIPDSVIAEAAKGAFDEDRNMAIGWHPDFRCWVWRELGDSSEMAKITKVRICGAEGIID